jgi:hypothetical protein
MSDEAPCLLNSLPVGAANVLRARPAAEAATLSSRDAFEDAVAVVGSVALVGFVD